MNYTVDNPDALKNIKPGDQITASYEPMFQLEQKFRPAHSEFEIIRTST